MGKWLLLHVPFAGESIRTYYKRIIYSVAAIQSNNFLILIFWGAFLGLIMGVAVSLVISMCRIYVEAQGEEKVARRQLENAANGIDDETMEDKTEKNNCSSEKDIEVAVMAKRVSLLLVILIIILAIITFSFIWIGVIKPALLWDKFEQDIIRIYPYVDEKQIYQLRSDWTYMRNEEDYLEIYKYIDNVKNTFSLPK